MTDLQQRLRTIERERPPELWGEVERRAGTEPWVDLDADPRTQGDLMHRGRGRKVGAILVAAAVAIAAFAFTERAFRRSTTPAPIPAVEPVAGGGWGPDGIAVVSDRSGADNVWVVDPSGGQPRQLTTNTSENMSYGGAVWSPDGTEIAFTTFAVRGNDGAEPILAWRTDHIGVVNADGSGEHELVIGSHPMWSPDGSQIAFVGGGGQDDPARYPAVVSVDGTGLTRLSDTLYVDEHGMPGPPAWSPDGDRIAFLEPGGRDAQLVVSSVDGVDKIRIDLGVIAGALRWSPDGSLLAFTGLREGADHASVYTVAPVQDAEPHELAEGTDPVWSPDGSRLAFLVACCSEGWAIHIVGPDGSNDHELKTSQVYPWGTSLIWSLDSSSVAYTGVIGMSSIGMWVAAADGSGASLLEDGQDSWVFAEPLT